jgi:hypothetical protein
VAFERVFGLPEGLGSLPALPDPDLSADDLRARLHAVAAEREA